MNRNYTFDKYLNFFELELNMKYICVGDQLLTL